MAVILVSFWADASMFLGFVAKDSGDNGIVYDNFAMCVVKVGFSGKKILSYAMCNLKSLPLRRRRIKWSGMSNAWSFRCGIHGTPQIDRPGGGIWYKMYCDATGQ